METYELMLSIAVLFFMVFMIWHVVWRHRKEEPSLKVAYPHSVSGCVMEASRRMEYMRNPDSVRPVAYTKVMVSYPAENTLYKKIFHTRLPLHAGDLVVVRFAEDSPEYAVLDERDTQNLR